MSKCFIVNKTILVTQINNRTLCIEKHNAALVKSTKAYIPWQLKYYEIYETRDQAMNREKFLKKQRNKDFYWRLINSQ
jgi:putative endonuclease